MLDLKVSTQDFDAAKPSLLAAVDHHRLGRSDNAQHRLESVTPHHAESDNRQRRYMTGAQDL